MGDFTAKSKNMHRISTDCSCEDDEIAERTTKHDITENAEANTMAKKAKKRRIDRPSSTKVENTDTTDSSYSRNVTR